MIAISSHSASLSLFARVVLPAPEAPAIPMIREEAKRRGVAKRKQRKSN